MNSNQEKFNSSVTPNNHEGMEVFLNMEEKKSIYRIYDLISPITHSEKHILDITEKVFSEYKIHCKGYESILVTLNYFELFELTYRLVHSTISEIQRVNYDSLDDLMKYGFNTLPLFLTPLGMTEEELEWVSGMITNNHSSEETEVEIKLPNDAERNYYINVRRILKENNSNPDFNESILNFLDRTRDLN